MFYMYIYIYVYHVGTKVLSDNFKISSVSTLKKYLKQRYKGDSKDIAKV